MITLLSERDGQTHRLRVNARSAERIATLLDDAADKAMMA